MFRGYNYFFISLYVKIKVKGSSLNVLLSQSNLTNLTLALTSSNKRAVSELNTPALLHQ